MINKFKNFKINWFISFCLFIGVLITATLLIYTNTYEGRSLYTAKQLLNEYNTKKAITLLENVRLQLKKDNPDLDFLLFYAYVRSNQLAKAKNLLHKLKDIEAENKYLFQEAVSRLNLHNEDEAMIEALEKAKKLNITEGFFINISQNRESIIGESSVIELGIKHLQHDETAVHHLKEYLIRRYIEAVENSLKEAKPDYARELKYLDKARKLAIDIQDESFQGSIHYMLGIAYKNTKDFDKAKEHLDLSSKLGNANAKLVLDTNLTGKRR